MKPIRRSDNELPGIRQPENKILWEEFCYAYLETGFFDFEGRPKTTKAMRHFWERVPGDVLDSLPTLTVFAPVLGILGEVLPCCGNGQMVYLAPDLERQSQAEVDFTVAHEFAHVLRKDGLPEGMRISKPTAYLDCPQERGADALVKTWGFEIPKRRKNGKRKTKE